MDPLIALRKVALVASAMTILERVNLRLEPGECVGIVGPNGSGKSTLLRILATLAAPTDGAGTVLGARLGSRAVLSVRHRIGLVGHLPALTPSLTLSENLSFYAHLAGIDDERVQGALADVGLAEASGRRAADCSAGMRKRADLARMLLNPTELVLLDEPTDTLDRSARPLVDRLVRDALDRRGAAVVVSHDRSNLFEGASRIYSLENGRLI